MPQAFLDNLTGRPWPPSPNLEQKTKRLFRTKPNETNDFVVTPGSRRAAWEASSLKDIDRAKQPWEVDKDRAKKKATVTASQLAMTGAATSITPSHSRSWSS